MKEAQSYWQKGKRYLRNPLVIFAIVEFFVLLIFIFYKLQPKR